MSTARSTPTAPRFVRHQKRPEWGIGRVIDVFQGLQRVRFADGTLREFREDVLDAADGTDAPPELHALEEIAAPPPRPSAHDRARRAKAAKAASADAPAAKNRAAK